ncbi:glycosyltransferase family 4 protein [Haladaptatus halobius]|uniref:glycosyltransferase family 4 protein n=1 Tax=Haladaptatus halobius TaxID=2884875 RepID=UPI001D0BAA44|nr:glycosyltransferase family 1 protein [Haladaptatus halobius]
MYVGLDARTVTGNISGVGNYLKNVIEAGAFDGHTVSAYYDGSEGESPIDIEVPDETTLKWRALCLPTRITDVLGSAAPVWWVNVSLANALRADDVDCFFGPNFVQPFTFGGPSVVVVHDMVHRRYPETHPMVYHWYLRTFLTGSLWRANHVITVSENTKRDVKSYHDVPESQLTVAYGAANETYRPRELSGETINRLQKKYDLPSEFLLYVGNLEPRKNLVALLRALWTFEDDERPPLVVVGQEHLTDEEFAAEYQRCPFTDRITFTGYVAEEDLPLLYDLASVFVYPSLYEGFGLPVLEALQSGTPVVTSDRSSLPEIVGDAALTANPQNPSTLADAIRHLWFDPDVYERYRRRGRQQACRFSWSRTALEIAAVLESVGSSDHNRHTSVTI